MSLATDTRAAAPAWKVWAALWTVYIVWGSTYLAIRVTVETLPPLFAMGVRFIVAGILVYVTLLIRRGREGVRVTPRQLLACGIVGTFFFLGANGMVAIAELDVPSSLAALIISSVPLWVILFRAIGGDRVRGGTLLGVLIGFSGVGILVLPGSRPSGATLIGVVLLIFASASWAFGSILSTRFDMPKDLMLSSGYQMITGGVALVVGGLIRGEASGFDPSAWSLASLAGMAYLVTIGSLVGFTAYAWLLQNAPISKVSTYAYVNPVVAIILGWLILSESITTNTLLGAAVIVGSVAFIVRKEAQPHIETEPQPALVGVEST
ncbi:MAG: EamA family transporter [Actinomycetota bacterium]|nr:EamA family transporter [Actinomycetota bacterium]